MHLPFLVGRGWEKFKQFRQRNKRTFTDFFDTALPTIGIIAIVVFLGLFIGNTIDSTKASDNKRCTDAYGQNWDHDNIDKSVLKDHKIETPADNDSDYYAACVKIEGNKTEYKVVPEKKDDN